MSGKRVPNSFAYFPPRVSGSAGFTLLAITRTSASSSFGSGRCTCSSFSTSGAPYSWATTACIFGFSSARPAESERNARTVTPNNRSLFEPARTAVIFVWDLFPLVDKNFPALDALPFENAALKPGIVLQLFCDLVFILRVDDQKRALRQAVS